MHVDLIRLNRHPFVLLAHSHFHLLFSENQRQHSKTQTIKLNEEKVVVTNRKCSNTWWVGFFPFKDCLKYIHQELRSGGKQQTHWRSFIRYFWDASFPLKYNVARLIHVCPTFDVRQKICIPSATCHWYCFYLRLEVSVDVARQQTHLEMLSPIYIFC